MAWRKTHPAPRTPRVHRAVCSVECPDSQTSRDPSRHHVSNLDLFRLCQPPVTIRLNTLRVDADCKCQTDQRPQRFTIYERHAADSAVLTIRNAMRKSQS